MVPGEKALLSASASSLLNPGTTLCQRRLCAEGEGCESDDAQGNHHHEDSRSKAAAEPQIHSASHGAQGHHELLSFGHRSDSRLFTA